MEVFERREIAGWVEVAAGSGPVRVDLCINNVPVTRTWAAPTTGRCVEGDLLDFRFGLADLWRYTKRKDRVSVRIGDRPVPITGKGTYYRPRKDGDKSLDALRERLTAGYVFSQSGRLQLSKQLDTEWQSAVLGLYARVNRILADRFRMQAFLCYGTLLGAVRDNGFIGHDLDFDCAYISSHRTGRAAAEELGEVAVELITRDFNVVPKRTCLAVEDDQSAGTKIDLYHLYRDESGQLSFPFGIAGDPELSRTGFADLRTITLAGRDVLLPTDAERLVEILYGSNWRTPIHGFSWENDRTASARAGIVSTAQVDEVARANVAEAHGSQPALIRSVLSAGAEMPDVVVEVGSSLGVDSVEIARTGKRVIGLERSRLSVEPATRRLESSELAAAVEFRTVEINDPKQLTAAIDTIRGAVGGSRLVLYARGYLGFSDRALRALVASLDGWGRAGDHLVAEFRPAPAGMWPKDKRPDATRPWSQADLVGELDRRSQWFVVSSKQAESSDEDRPDDKSGVVVARRT